MSFPPVIKSSIISIWTKTQYLNPLDFKVFPKMLSIPSLGPGGLRDTPYVGSEVAGCLRNWGFVLDHIFVQNWAKTLKCHNSPNFWPREVCLTILETSWQGLSETFRIFDLAASIEELWGRKEKTLGASGAWALTVLGKISWQAGGYDHFVLPNWKAASEQLGRSRKITSPPPGLLEVWNHSRWA